MPCLFPETIDQLWITKSCIYCNNNNKYYITVHVNIIKIKHKTLNILELINSNLD